MLNWRELGRRIGEGGSAQFIIISRVPLLSVGYSPPEIGNSLGFLEPKSSNEIAEGADLGDSVIFHAED